MGITFDDLLAKATAPRRTVKVCLDGSLGEQVDTARQDWDEARRAAGLGADPAVAAKFDHLAELEALADEATVELTMESIGSTAWRHLINEHPPGEDDPEYRWDLEDFPVAAVAASCVEPAMTFEQAQQLAAKLSNGQWEKLWVAAYTVNAGDDLIPKFASGTGSRSSSEPSSTTAAPEESHTDSL